ncbi:MAG: hypothetical protein K2G53_00350 [Muribaculaceae bacterium]|nr:hypothetical protein [Muribaculaceae bacterium]
MNKKFVTIIMVTLAVICHCGIINAQTPGNVIIGLLSETPTRTISDCNGQDLMTLLSNDGKEWIESIECQNVDIVAGQAGAQLVTTADTTEPSYIKFNFKTSPLLKATNVTFYGNDRLDKEVAPSIIVNDLPCVSNANYSKFKHITDADNASAAAIQVAIENPEISSIRQLSNGRIYTQLDNNLIQSCEIAVNANERVNIQLFALRVFYSGQETNSQSSVVEDLESAITDVKYFDLQGRELKDAPQKGIYLRHANGKTTKHIAR